MTATSYTPAGYLLARVGVRRSVLIHRRSAVVTVCALALTLAVATLTMATGPYAITPQEALGTLLGGGSATDRFIVLDQRLPRAVAAALVGIALGGSGAIFQSVSRNALGSPDIVGFTTGAASGGLIAILVVGAGSSSPVFAGTIIGGAATALVVIAFALRRGATGDRLVLSGIAIAAMLAAVNDYLISRAPLESAEAAKAWQHGSLNAITWAPLLPLAVTLPLIVPVAILLTRRMRLLELGDDSAAGVGVHVIGTRITAIVTGIALVAVGVATAGPIGFLALAAPQLARRLTGAPGIAPGASMAIGAALLVIADLLAQRLLSPFQIPVGLVTSAVGGAYLVWLLTLARQRV
ncbi:MAG: iron chelate uptake ABC transporter family permease subunit [Propioniciclava sp.]|uniref:FecCD family ABC transporter permease n=1 Tax=Propioniciclava sp. TaxID=2038686 RepID=UPI0039E43AE2